MARVYLALSKRAAGFSKFVVLKVLRSSVTEDTTMRRMFFDEARIAALLNHPNVVQTYEAGEDEGRLFLAMEYLEGKSLSAILGARPPGDLPLDVHLRIIADMLEGLHYAHGVADVDGAALDIVHRDVSPQNVLVTFSGQSKVVDFGIAKIAGAPVTQSGIIKGKAGYMAPEQIHNKNVDRRADVFAAGVMIWEAIARRRLMLRGEDEVVALARRMGGGDPSVRSVAPPGTPEELLVICDRAMHADTKSRYTDAHELHDALDRYLRKTGGADQKRVAEVLEKLFGAERKKTKSFVEEQMRVADDSSPLIDIAKQRSVALPSLSPIPLSIPSSPEINQQAEHRASTGVAQIADVLPRQRSKVTLALVAFGALAVIGVVAGIAAIGARSSSAAAPPSSVATAAANEAPTASATTTVASAPVSAPTPSAPSEHESAWVEETPVPRPTTMGRADAGAKPHQKRAIDDGDPYRR